MVTPTSESASSATSNALLDLASQTDSIVYDGTSAVATSVNGNGGMGNYKAHNLFDS